MAHQADLAYVHTPKKWTHPSTAHTHMYFIILLYWNNTEHTCKNWIFDLQVSKSQSIDNILYKSVYHSQRCSTRITWERTHTSAHSAYIRCFLHEVIGYMYVLSATWGQWIHVCIQNYMRSVDRFLHLKSPKVVHTRDNNEQWKTTLVSCSTWLHKLSQAKLPSTI